MVRWLGKTGILVPKARLVIKVFEYRAAIEKGGEHVESGTIVAEDEMDAKKKLKEQGFPDVLLKRLHGLEAFLVAFGPYLE